MFKWKRRLAQPALEPALPPPAPTAEKDKPLSYNLLTAQLRILERNSELTIIDAGAHHGHTTEQYLENFPRSRVIAIEPDRENFAKAAARVASFGERVELVRAGLSETAGTADLHRNGYDMTHSLLELGDMRYYDEPFAALEAEKIDTLTVDDLCAERKIGMLDVLKMDIQGSELKALRGATAMLSRGAIRLVVLEVNFVPLYRNLPTFWDVADHLRAYGYGLQGIYELRHQPGTPAILCWADAIFVAPQMQVLPEPRTVSAGLDEGLETVGGRPLPADFLVEPSLLDGATIREGEPLIASQSVTAVEYADGRQTAIAAISDAIIDTSTVAYCYSVIMKANPSVARTLRVGGMVTVEFTIEVLEGKIGIVWTDESYHPLESTERYIAAMSGIQRVLVSVPSERLHHLVLRNVIGESARSSFKLHSVRAKVSR